MEERQLIKECIRGELHAQKMMYELHAPAMMSVCLRYVANRETARDLLHDGFVKLFTKIHTYSGVGSFNNWLKKIFVTTALEYLRKNSVLKNNIDIGVVDNIPENVDVSVFEYLTTDDLMLCIARLPDNYRTVFNMHAIEGYTHVEIARKFGINENTSRANYAKARKLLQKIVIEKVKSEELKIEKNNGYVRQ